MKTVHFFNYSIFNFHRPQLLVLVKVNENEFEANQKLLQLAGQLKAGQGLTIVATLIDGDLTQHEDRERAEAIDEVSCKNVFSFLYIQFDFCSAIANVIKKC